MPVMTLVTSGFWCRLSFPTAYLTFQVIDSLKIVGILSLADDADSLVFPWREPIKVPDSRITQWHVPYQRIDQFKFRSRVIRFPGYGKRCHCLHQIVLEEIAQVAKEKGWTVHLRGSCDSATATAEYNKALAQRRCNTIMNILVEKGVPMEQIELEPVGGVKELDPTEYDRRVLITLGKKIKK